MFHKIKSVHATSGYRIKVIFAEGITKIYNVKPIIEYASTEEFKALKKYSFFLQVKVAKGNDLVYWENGAEIPAIELFKNGETITTPFDHLLALSDACELWHLNESTLRKAIAYHRLVEGVDVYKFGKQWVILYKSMVREYGIIF